jgi:predicted DsbA family dithiol-disulfide isomerase
LAELAEKHDLAVEWLPYELRPAPAPLPDIAGPDGPRYRANWERGVAPLAEQFGVEMHFTPIKPRSRLAHEAAEAARAQVRFEAMRVALFRADIVDSRDIGQLEVLIEIGREVGLDAERLRDELERGVYTERVEQLESIALEIGVRAVPTIVIGGLAVEGVRPYAVLERVLEEARRRSAASAQRG